LSNKDICSIKDCSEPGYKSLSFEDASKVFGGQLTGKRRVKLCKKHWKEYKKATKKERKLERWRWG